MNGEIVLMGMLIVAVLIFAGTQLFSIRGKKRPPQSAWLMPHPMSKGIITPMMLKAQEQYLKERDEKRERDRKLQRRMALRHKHYRERLSSRMNAHGRLVSKVVWKARQESHRAICAG